MKFYCLATRNLKEIYRDPVSILLGLAMPVVLLILFSSIQKNVRLEMFSPQSLTPGMIIFCFAFLIMFSAILLAKDRSSAFLIRLYTTPLKPSDFILAYMLPFVPLALFQAIICLLVGTILGASFVNIVASLLLLVLISLLFISLGIIFGSLLSINQVSGIGSLFITAIGMFSGAWMDLKTVGGIFESVGYALPFAYAVDTSKGLLSGQSFEDISAGFYILLMYTIALVFLAIVSFRWSMRRD